MKSIALWFSSLHSYKTLNFISVPFLCAGVIILMLMQVNGLLGNSVFDVKGSFFLVFVEYKAI